MSVRRTLQALLVAVMVTSLLPSGANAIVIGGRDASEEYPFMVSVQSATGRHFCGGSLVAKRWVLTAGHCADGEEPTTIKVMLGSHQLSKPGEVLEVSKIIMHEGYDSNSLENDVALLKLATRSSYKPIPVATLQQKSLWQPGTVARVIGWGTSIWLVGPASDRLQEVDVPIVSDSDCARSYTGQGFDPKTMVCAGENTGLKDSCNGDSGGPLLVRDEDGRLVQVGVVSWGTGCGFPLMYGVYARIGDDALRPWLATHAKI